MGYLILGELKNIKNMIIPYTLAIIALNLLVSDSLGAIVVIILSVKGLRLSCLNDALNSDNWMVSQLPKNRKYIVLQKHIFSIVLYLIGMIVWYLSRSIYIQVLIDLNNFISQELYRWEYISIILAFSMIVTFLYNEVYLIFHFRHGALKANNLVKPFFLGFAMLFLLFQNMNKSLNIITEERIVNFLSRVGATNLIIISLLISAIFILIGSVISIASYNKSDIVN